MAITFDDVGSAALADALILLPQWLSGGTRRGHEYLGERKANGGPGDSWTVNLNTGAWMHGAGSEKGGDLVSLYAALNHINNVAALKQVAQLVGVVDGRAPRTLPRTAPIKAPQKLPDRIPEGTPDPEPHPTLGTHAACYRYGNAFAIARYERQTESGPKKEFIQLTWRHGKWARLSHPAPRPPYNADLLPKHPTAPVMIVEGEKCADIASQQLRAYVCMTWAGGSNAVKQTDWACLEGRDVIIWPDADEPGRAAAAELAVILKPIATRVRVVQPNGQSPGWDIADAVSEGMGPHEIAKWCAAHITDKISKPASEPAPTPAVAKQLPTESSISTEDSGPAAAEPAIDSEYLPVEERKHSKNYPDGQPPQSAVLSWQSLPVRTNEKGIPHATLSNASLIIQYHEEFKDKIWFDSFRGKVFHTLHGAPKQWTDADDRRVTAWIQQRLELPKFTLMTVHEAVLHAAECNQRNSLTDWLDSLKWDGTQRLDTWLFDCLGTTRNAYNDAVARNWPISMVARAYDPGCQVDTMPVLEGKMGRGKSSFLRILADPWFAAVQIAFGEKDFFQAIQGKWLIEVPDMSGFSRREHTQIIATISNQNDVYRQSHGRNTEDHQRVTIFAATSENDEYLQESRGRRRYWPLVCGDINLDALRSQREQIFAEAVVKYRAGATWYEMPEETDAEQAARASRDIWTDRVLNYAELYGDNNLTSAMLLEKAIEMDTDRMDDGAKKRIYRIMMEAGYKQLHGRKERYWKKTSTETEK